MSTTESPFKTTIIAKKKAIIVSTIVFLFIALIILPIVYFKAELSDSAKKGIGITIFVLIAILVMAGLTFAST